MAAATIMLFTIITFFVKFAVILFLTVVQATVGSFIVFLTLADTFGPSQPTFVVDWISAKLCGSSDTAEEGDGEKKSDEMEVVEEDGDGGKDIESEVNNAGEGNEKESSSTQLNDADEERGAVQANDVEEETGDENCEDDKNGVKMSDSHVNLLDT